MMILQLLAVPLLCTSGMKGSGMKGSRMKRSVTRSEEKVSEAGGCDQSGEKSPRFIPGLPNELLAGCVGFRQYFQDAEEELGNDKELKPLLEYKSEFAMRDSVTVKSAYCTPINGKYFKYESQSDRWFKLRDELKRLGRDSELKSNVSLPFKGKTYTAQDRNDIYKSKTGAIMYFSNQGQQWTIMLPMPREKSVQFRREYRGIYGNILEKNFEFTSPGYVCYRSCDLVSDEAGKLPWSTHAKGWFVQAPSMKYRQRNDIPRVDKKITIE